MRDVRDVCSRLKCLHFALRCRTCIYPETCEEMLHTVYLLLVHGMLRAWQSATYICIYICISSELSLCRHISFAGNLPDSWGAPRVLPEFEKLFLGGNRFSGPLPAAWGGRDRLPKLLHLVLNDNALEGTVQTAGYRREHLQPSLRTQIRTAPTAAFCRLLSMMMRLDSPESCESTTAAL